MSALQSFLERIVRRLKGDASYRIASVYSNRQLATVLWYRGVQSLRGIGLRLGASGVRGVVFRGRHVVIEHADQLSAGPGLILEDGVFISALSASGIILGRNVTVARGANLICTGVLARMGNGIRIGSRSAIGAGCFLGGQGGITIGDDVIIGPGVRIFSENHNYGTLDRPIREQGETRAGVTIGDDCWIGASVTIVDGVSIGNGSVIAGGAVVTGNIPPFTIAAGVPARVIRSRRADERTQAQLASTPARAQAPLSAHGERVLQEDR